MFNNLIKYYLKNAQLRIKNRIDLINEERTILRASGDIRYKKLRDIKNTHLYSNKPQTIKEIREGKSEILIDKLSVIVAESLIDNLKLKPDFKIKSSNKTDEIKMKKDNLEFISLQELLWGFDEIFTPKDKFNFFLNLFLDLRNSSEYSSMIHGVLIDYIPFARYSALEKALNEDVEFASMIAPNYKHTNIDVFAEAVYAFCMSDVSDEVMTLFVEFLHTPYYYESKDSDGRFLIKNSSVNYQNFEQAFSKVLDNVLKPISQIETYHSLGKRVYDIVIDDYEINSVLLRYSMVRSPESYGYYLTKTEKPDVEVMSTLLEASDSYIEKLMQIQQDFYGNVEKEYFNSEMFSPSATEFYSEDRFFQMLEQKQLEEFEEEVKAYDTFGNSVD